MNLLGLPSLYFVEGLDMVFLPCWLTLPHVWIYRAIGWSHHDCYLLVLSQRTTPLIAIFKCLLPLRGLSQIPNPLVFRGVWFFHVLRTVLKMWMHLLLAGILFDILHGVYIYNSNKLIGGLYCRVEGPCCITFACSDSNFKQHHIF